MITTIGIPFYNAEETLYRAIQSVFAQSSQEWELILMNDGSTDKSLDIALAINDPRVRVLSDGINMGLPFRLNQIASLARGKYLARMDADDIMHPNRLERQVDYLEANPEVDFVSTAAYLIDRTNNVVGIRGDENHELHPYAVLSKGVILHPTITGRTEWFRCNPYDVNFRRTEDRELWCRSFLTSRFEKIPEPLYFYRDGYSSIINVYNYLNSCSAEYKIYLTYGPRLVGKPRTYFLIARTFIKSLIVRTLSYIGLQGCIWKLKRGSIDDNARKIGQTILSQVINTSISTSR